MAITLTIYTFDTSGNWNDQKPTPLFKTEIQDSELDSIAEFATDIAEALQNFKGFEGTTSTLPTSWAKFTSMFSTWPILSTTRSRDYHNIFGVFSAFEIVIIVCVIAVSIARYYYPNTG